MYGTFSLMPSGINVLRGTLRNYAELFSFFELGGSLCFAHATEHSGTHREWYRTQSGLSSHVADTRKVSHLFMWPSSRVAGFQHRYVSCHTYLFLCKVRRSAKFRGLSEAKASAKFQKKKKFRVVPTSSAQNIKCASI